MRLRACTDLRAPCTGSLFVKVSKVAVSKVALARESCIPAKARKPGTLTKLVQKSRPSLGGRGIEFDLFSPLGGIAGILPELR